MFTAGTLPPIQTPLQWIGSLLSPQASAITTVAYTRRALAAPYSCCRCVARNYLQHVATVENITLFAKRVA
jgi:hypothetical protein